MDINKKIKGLVFGAAIGDALGFISEFKNRDKLEKYIEELKNNKLSTLTHRTYPIDYPYGQYSDDTQFSLLLIKNILDHNDLKPKEYFNLLKSEFQKNNLVGIGSNTRKLLSDVTNNINNSSNGSIMRTYPIGLLFPKDDILMKAKLQSKITHDHPDAIEACQIFSMLVYKILNNQGYTNLLKKKIDIKFLDLTIEEFISFAKKNYHRDNWNYIPPGATITLLAAIYAFHNSKDFDECLFTGLFLGGDTDSVASLACGLKGLSLGFNSIPEKFRNIPFDQENKVDELNNVVLKIEKYREKNNIE